MQRRRPAADPPPDDDWPSRMLRGAPVLLAYLDIDQRVVFANHAHQTWTGIDPAALIGQRAVDVVGKRNYASAWPALCRAFAGQAASFESMVFDGEQTRYVHGNFAPDLDGDGLVRGVFSALVDITERRTLELQLHESEQRFAAAFHHAAIAMALTSADGRFLRVNDAACRMLGYGEAELLRLGPQKISHADDVAEDLAQLAQLVSGALDAYQVDKRYLHKDGHTVHVRVNVAVVRDRSGAPLYFVSQAQDVSARKASEDALHRERELAEVTLRSIGDGVITTNRQLQIASINPIAEAMTGWTQAEAHGRSVDEVFRVFDAAGDATLPNPLREAINANAIVDVSARSVLRHRHGFDTPVQHSCAPIHDHAGNVIGGVLVFHDVSEHRALALKMLHLTQHDALTGLPNRSQLQSRTELAIATAARRQQRCAMLHIGVGNFKQVNELYGRANGDRVLRALVAQMRLALTGDELLLRHDGDEFVVALPHLESAADAAAVCQRLLAFCVQTTVPDLPPLALRMSVGVSLFPDDAVDAERLLRHAEAAQRAARAQGHGYRFFTASMDERALELRQIESALRTALSAGQLTLHYQPKVSADDLHVVGAEALMRWMVDDHPRYQPDQFIPVAEDSGLIVPIGTWALHEACRQLRRWQDRRRAISLSVNVSPLQFQHPDFYGELTTALDASGANPAGLELEVTERMLMSGGDATTHLLRRIRRTGVRLSLDDFGTGYCSLSYLRRFPIDALKIDHAFVRELTTDADTATITRAIISMARSLNKLVIAEGVETAGQEAFLRDAGCTQLQGYRYGAAMPAADLDALIDQPG